MAKSQIVKIAEKHNLMMSEGLWLTSGGRVVKPSWGEYANEKHSDQLLLTKVELEKGISFVEFQKRLNQAIKLWKKKYPNKEPMGQKTNSTKRVNRKFAPCLTCSDQWYADRNTNCKESCNFIKNKKRRCDKVGCEGHDGQKHCRDSFTRDEADGFIGTCTCHVVGTNCPLHSQKYANRIK